MLITYAYIGVEGAAHDSFVLQEAQTRGNLQMPQDGYASADCGYGMRRLRVLVPYRNVRYHLREWMTGVTSLKVLKKLHK